MKYRGIEIRQSDLSQWYQFDTDDDGGACGSPALDLCRLHIDDMLQEWETVNVSYVRPGSATGLPETARDIPVSRILPSGYQYNDHNVVEILNIQPFKGYRPPQDMVTLYGAFGTE